MKSLRPVLYFVFVCVSFCGCENRAPKGLIGEGLLENILYDYHLAQAMAETASDRDSTDFLKRYYERAVLDKYGVTEARFDSSMAWYTRHSDKLFKVYQRIDKRFAETASAVGGMAVAGGVPLPFSGDTANVWRGPDFCILSPTENNRFQFSQEADSSFHEGSRLAWSFQTRWIYKEGMKSAAAVLCVRYDNDSVAAVTQGIYNTGRQQLSLVLGKRKVKSVSGLVYQNAPWSEKPKLLVLSGFSLIRYKAVLQPKVPEGPPVAAEADSTALFMDSIRRQERLDRQSRFREADVPEEPRPAHRRRLAPRNR